MDSSKDWTNPSRPRRSFPPYDLGDQEFVARADAQTKKLARIYTKGHELAWDGPKMLDELIAKHGGIHFPEAQKAAFGRVASVLLWGELAAWSVSADIALKLNEPSAKMAASSQVFDEARHFWVLREYMWRAGIPVQKLGGYSRTLLVGLLETDNLMYKLVGMQLLVENAAVTLFKMIAAAEIEPVLTDLLYYFERDEARHVGLGVLALPRILAQLTDLEAAKLWAFQLRMQLLMLGGGLSMRQEFATLGVDQAAMQRHTFHLQHDVFRRMREVDGGDKRRSATKGLFNMSRTRQKRLHEFLFPKPDAPVPTWHKRALAALTNAAKTGDQWLARLAPAT